MTTVQTVAVLRLLLSRHSERLGTKLIQNSCKTAQFIFIIFILLLVICYYFLLSFDE